MIAEISTLKRVCCEPLERIENYSEAINDSMHMWHLHHKLGLNHTIKELQENDMYLHRPANELIFLNSCREGEDVYMSHAGVHSRGKRALQAEFEYQSMLDRMGREQCRDNSIISNKMAFESWVQSYLVADRIKTRMDNEMLSAATGLSQKFISDLLDE
jgi:hypothetical protein